MDTKLCECGCGKSSRYNKKTQQWSKYADGHHPYTEEIRKKMSDSSRKRWGHPLEKFKFRIGEKDSNGCMRWIGTHDTDGYGVIKWFGKMVKAHRIAYEQVHGELLDNLVIQHTCDVRDCVNPEHLILGSLRENRKDCVEKKRHAFGSKHGNAKLIERDVKTIRLMYEFGYSQEEISKKFDINKSNVGHIVSRHSWKHVT